MNFDTSHVVAPMVHHSELAWRMMLRKHGATLCYTPMVNGNNFLNDPRYRRDELDLHHLDRPVVVQFSANTPEMFLFCAKHVESSCDGVDLNLGCPQNIAKRGRYGSFLQEEWQLIHNIIRTTSTALSIPVSCKIRIFDSLEKSIQYAQMIEKAGCSMLCVHGRTQNQKGPATGIANWDTIKSIKESVSIPVISNGNIIQNSDIQRCRDYTKTDGVMVAETCLYNPYIFEGSIVSMFEAAREYISFARIYDAKIHYWRSHLFKILHAALDFKNHFREDIGNLKDLNQAENLVDQLENECLKINDDANNDSIKYSWHCRPRLRNLN